MKIACDIDGVVVDTAYLWFIWLSMRFEVKEGCAIPVNKPLPYDLTKLFDTGEFDGYDFWRDLNLYNGLSPIKGSLEVLHKLKAQGHEILFVSQCKGYHHKGKYKFIEKWFPFYDAVIFTKEKHYVKCDIVIDDSISQLNSFPSNVYRIWFDTNYYQEGVEPSKGTVLCKGWDNVYLTIQDIKANKECSRFIERGNVWAVEQNM